MPDSSDCFDIATVAAFVEAFPDSLHDVEQSDLPRLIGQLQEAVGAEHISVKAAMAVARRMGSEDFISPSVLCKRLALVLSVYCELDVVPWEAGHDHEAAKWIHRLAGDDTKPDDATAPKVDVPEEFKWLPPSLTLATRLQAIQRAAPALVDVAARKRILDKLPYMVGIPRAPINNAPQVPKGDLVLRKVDDQVRDISRSLVIMHGKLTRNPDLEVFHDLPVDMLELIENTFALSCALTHFLNCARIKETSPHLVPPAVDDVVLINKENMKVLEERSRLEKACGKPKFATPPAAQRYQPYAQPWGGKGKGKGKGHGKGKFSFQSPTPGPQGPQ